MLVLQPDVSHDGNTYASASVMLILAHIVSHDQNNHSTLHFHHLDIMNAMVPLVSHEADTSANGAISQEK